MIIIPAIDLKNGKCVRLRQGKTETAIVFNEDPIKQAQLFESLGCKKIHIVDIDAATSKKKNNEETIENIINSVSIDIQLGGGIRNTEQIMHWLERGVKNLIISSLAVENPNLLKKIILEFPNKITIGIDDKDNFLMTSGWLNKSNTTLESLIKIYENCLIEGFVYTDTKRDGTLKGIDIEKIINFSKKTKKNILVGGGLTSINDISNICLLKLKNIKGIIIGKAYYSGLIDLKEAEETIKNA